MLPLRAVFPSHHSVQPEGLSGTVAIIPNEANSDGALVEVSLTGLQPGAIHAMHIHEEALRTPGDTSSTACDSLGGHWNPLGSRHGSTHCPSKGRHAGDLMNNIFADSQGMVQDSFRDPLIQVRCPCLWPTGRSIVIHCLSDDLGLQGVHIDYLSGRIVPPGAPSGWTEEFSHQQPPLFVSYESMQQTTVAYVYAISGYKGKASHRGQVDKLESKSLTTGNAGRRIACANLI